MAIQAGGDYGTGHLARCKTLARTLEEHYAAGVTFWFDGPSSRIARELAEEGCNVVEGNWSLPEAVRQGKYSRVVIDFQTLVPPSLIHGIRMCDPELPIIVMDNNGLGAVDADAVIFPNAHAKINPELRESPERLYEGPLYVVLGAGFLHDPTDWQEEAPIDRATVLISMGGRDPELLTEKVLDSLKDLRDAHIDLVVPPLYPYPENLEKIATRLPSTVTLHWRIRNLRPLMKRTTIAVAAFGVTAYELAYMHVPTILLGHYESQVEDMERFCKLGTAVSAGWGVSLEPDSLYRMVTTLIEDEEARKAMAERGAALIDDKGPLRVAEAIVATTHIPVSVVRTEGL